MSKGPVMFLLKCLSKHCKTKDLQRYCWVIFVLTICFWAWDLPLRVVCIFRESPLKGTNSSFASGYQVEIASGVVMGSCAHFCLLKSHLVQPHAGPVHAATVSAGFTMPCFLAVLHPLVLRSFRLFFHRVPWALRRRDLIQTFSTISFLYSLEGDYVFGPCSSPTRMIFSFLALQHARHIKPQGPCSSA